MHWPGELPTGLGWAARRRTIHAALHAALVEVPHVRTEWGSLTVAAQMVVVSVPTVEVDAVVTRLEARGLRVDPLVERQVIS